MHRRNLDGLAYSVAVLELHPPPDWAGVLVSTIEHELTQAQAQGEKVGCARHEVQFSSKAAQEAAGDCAGKLRDQVLLGCGGAGVLCTHALACSSFLISLPV